MNNGNRNAPRRGMTLLELLVALALLGIMTAVVDFAMKARVNPSGSLVMELDSLRDEALRTGRPQRAWLQGSTRSGRVLVLPTGRVIADSSLGIDPLTGSVQR